MWKCCGNPLLQQERGLVDQSLQVRLSGTRPATRLSRFLRFTCDQIKYASGILPKCDVGSKRKFHEYSWHAQQTIHSFTTAVCYKKPRAQTASTSRAMTASDLKQHTAPAGISTGELSTRSVM